MPLYTRNMLILLTSICLFFSSFYLLLPTLPLYVHYIGGDQKDVGFIVGIFTLSSVLFRPLAGTFTDKVGRKVLLVTGAVIFFVAPFLYFFSNTTEILLLVRIFHGVGIATFTVSSVTLIADLSPPHRRGEAFGAFGLAAMIALSGAPAGGTWLLKTFSFTEVFYAEAICAGLCILLCFFVREPAHVSVFGKTGRPSRIFYPSLIILICTVTYGSIVAFLPFFASKISDFGLYYTFYAVSSVAVRIPLGRASDRVGREKIILPGLLTVAVSLVILSVSTSLILLVLSGLLYGVGFSSVYPTLTASLVDRIPEETRGKGLSYFTASFDLGIGIGSVVFGFFPLIWIYPVGSLLIIASTLIFYVSERSRLSSSR